MSCEAESIERAALADLHAAATAEQVEMLGLRALTLGSALVSVAAALPSSAIVINRTIGLGLGSPATETVVREIVQAYRERDIERFFIHRHPQAEPDQLVAWFEAAGLERARGWQKFRRGREPVPEVPSDLRIERIGTEHGEAFGRIVADAFDLGDVASSWLARLAGRARWHIFMSFQGDEPAGAGAVFIRGRYAWTDYGATVPKHRQQGSQGALLAHRIAFAIDRGCCEVFTCTGEEVPGDPQHSFRNIEKLAFQRDYVRENYAPPKC